MEYKEPMFRLVYAANNDVITTSWEEAQQQSGSSGLTPGQYDTPFIKL